MKSLSKICIIFRDPARLSFKNTRKHKILSTKISRYLQIHIRISKWTNNYHICQVTAVADKGNQRAPVQAGGGYVVFVATSEVRYNSVELSRRSCFVE